MYPPSYVGLPGLFVSMLSLSISDVKVFIILAISSILESYVVLEEEVFLFVFSCLYHSLISTSVLLIYWIPLQWLLPLLNYK
jgi:hypothetical protein